MKKKGQITIFVVLGIVLLMVAGLFLVVRNISVSEKPPFLETDVSLEVKPVNEFVTVCLKAIAKEGLVKLGRNGGHIVLEGLTASPFPYQSDVILFEPETVAYWDYLMDCPESSVGCITTNKPPLCEPSRECVLRDSFGDNSIQEQLSEYIDVNLPKCIRNFRSFEDQFSITNPDIKAETFVSNGSVFFKIDYPIEITSLSTGQKETIPHFVTELDVDLLDLYLFATEIFEVEKTTAFFEHQTLNLITAYSGLDKDLLPPTSEIQMFTAPKIFWVRSKVEEQLTYDVLPYMSLIQIANAQNAKIIAPFDDNSTYWKYAFGFFRNMEMKTSNNIYDLDATVSYPFLPIYLRIGNSEIIKPDQIDAGEDAGIVMKLLNFFLDDYRFKYDLSYPLIISLRDNDAFNGEGYDFKFGLEVNIYHNVPVNSTITPISISTPYGISLNSLEQRPDRVITVETKDKHTGDPLEDVIIYYRCGREFMIGATKMKDGKAILEETFPFCQFGGQIRFEKQGYMGSSELYDNLEGSDPKYFTFGLWPVQKKEVIIKKRTPQNVYNIESQGAGAIRLYESETTTLRLVDKVIFNINRVKESPYESDVPFIGFLAYAPTNAMTGVDYDDKRAEIIYMYYQGLIDEETKDRYLDELEGMVSSQSTSAGEYELGFVPGDYKVEAYLTYEGGVYLAAETKEVCKGACAGDTDDWGECDGTCVPLSLDLDATEDLDLEEQNFTMWVSGGAKINITLTENDVYNTDKVTFYVLEMPLPGSWDDMLDVKPIEEYQQDKTFLLNPVFE